VGPFARAEQPALATATSAETVREFPYKAIEPLTLDGKQGRLRPVLAVRLIDDEGNRIAQTRGLVDSGMDCTTLPIEWADLLGIDVARDCVPEAATQADGKDSPRQVYTDGLRIEVVDEELFLDIVHFSTTPSCAFLGRRDLFDRHLVLFDQRQKRFYLERQPTSDDEDEDPELALAAS
jgi:hypothetical protein